MLEEIAEPKLSLSCVFGPVFNCGTDILWIMFVFRFKYCYMGGNYTQKNYNREDSSGTHSKLF